MFALPSILCKLIDELTQSILQVETLDIAAFALPVAATNQRSSFLPLNETFWHSNAAAAAAYYVYQQNYASHASTMVGVKRG